MASGISLALRVNEVQLSKIAAPVGSFYCWAKASNPQTVHLFTSLCIYIPLVSWDSPWQACVTQGCSVMVHPLLHKVILRPLCLLSHREALLFFSEAEEYSLKLFKVLFLEGWSL